MASLFEIIYSQESMKTQTCIYCNKTANWRGWEGLCNRQCYYDICELLYEFNKGRTPDSRIIDYFTRYPTPSHSFDSEKILKYIKDK